MSVKTNKFVIHFDAVYGQIEYDSDNKTFRVLLDDIEKKRSVEQYLNESHAIKNADGNDLMTFHAKSVFPVESLECFKLALTRLWQFTGVYVDWSRPPE